MTNDEYTGLQRLLLAAACVERRFDRLADDAGLCVLGQVWNDGGGMSATRIHRLDVAVDDIQLRIWFTEDELLDFLVQPDGSRVELRLRDLVKRVEELDQVLAQVLPPPPLRPLRPLLH